MMTQNANLLVEIFVEELPPKALNQLGEAFATVLHQHLKTMGLASATSQLQVFASPRRLAAHISDVAKRANDVQIEQKLMPVSVGLDQSGLATPALQKKLQALSLDVSVVSQIKQKMDGESLTLFVDSMVKGVELQMGLQKALEESLSKLPIPKLMTYQLEKDCELPGWSSVYFVRPVHGLLALHGSDVVAVHALGLQASNTTQGHRFEALKPVIVIEHADVYAQVMAKEGAVIASFAKRREEIRTQLEMAAKQIGGVKPIDDEALLNEVTAFVERPKVMVCGFEKEFLSVPQECLILTMKANQKYFPLLDESGRLTHQFLVVSNINPSDPSAVIGGNQRVVRPRLADAQFFFDQDRKKTLASRVDGLKQVVYHNKLGTQGDRMLRVKALATKIAMMLGEDAMVASVESAAQLAKTDLLTDMVGEFPELQGIMGGYYARHDGLSDSVAWAIEDHYKPRFAGDELPRQTVGLVVALADKLETLIGMFGIGNLPSGEKDPFALRRHALGVIRMLVEKNLNLPLGELLHEAYGVFGPLINSDEAQVVAPLRSFMEDRLTGQLREQAYGAKEIEAVLALKPELLCDVTKRLSAVRAFSQLPQAAALAAANKRIGNVLKKAEGVTAVVNEKLFQESAEKNLYAQMQLILPKADALFQSGDYTACLQTLAGLRESVDAYFDGVMVNAPEENLRNNRLGQLKLLHNSMNRVADLSSLAT